MTNAIRFSNDKAAYWLASIGRISGMALAILSSSLTYGQVRPSDFKVSGNAVFLDSSCVRLTLATNNQSGSLWFQQRIDLNYDFDVTARINLGNIDASGADGITFALQPLSNTIGGAGGGMGIAGVTPCIAVEFDTWTNDDPPYDHIALIKNGDVNHYSSPGNTLQGPFELLPNQANAEDGQFRPVRFVWNATTKRFQAYYNGVLKIDIVQDFINTVFSGNPYVFWGFTAATGGAINEHKVCLDSYSVVREFDCKSANILQRDTSICGNATLQLSADTLPPFAMSCAQMPQAMLAGLVACYSFAGNATDQSGNNHHGTISGASFVNDRIGTAASALQLTGNGWVTVADNDSLRLMNTDFSINLWVKPSLTTQQGFLVYKGVSAGNNYPKYLFEYDNGSLNFHINGPGLVGGLWYRSQKFTPASGWFMVTAVKRGLTMAFYVDGASVGQVAFPLAIPNTQGSTLRIGGPEPNAGNTSVWQGGLDDVTFFRRALQPVEIADMAAKRGKYRWSTGESTRQINVAPASSTTYYLEVVEGSRVCLDSVRISVSPRPRITILPAAPLSVCFGSGIALQASSDQSGTRFRWRPADGLSSDTAASVLARPLTSMQYTVLGTSSQGCLDSASVRVDVKPKPKVTITPSAARVCLDSSLSLTASTGAVNSTFLWSPSTGLSSTTSANVRATPKQSGVYQVVATSTDGCRDTATTNVTVVDPPSINVTPSQSSICIGGQVRLTVTSNRPNVVFTWSPATGLSSTTGAIVTAKPVSNTTYSVSVRDADGCRATDSAIVRLLPNPRVDAGRDTSILPGTGIQLKPLASSDVVGYLWTPSNYLSCTTCPNPTSTPLKPITYLLRVRNADGCEAVDSVSISLSCDARSVFIPNTFSPNGDGMNDIFFPRGAGIRRVVYLRVFDRWGNKVFERKDFGIEDPTQGWDGRYQGSILKPGVFVYTSQMECENRKLLDLKGSITIIE